MKLIRMIVKAHKWLYHHRRGGLRAVLVVAAILSIDWGSAQEDLPPRTRAHMQDCAMAQRSLGAGFLAARPDCGKYLKPR